MRIEYQHDLDNQETYLRMARLIQELQKKYADKISNPITRWNKDHTRMDFSMEIMGFDTNGQVLLEDGQVTLEGKLPLMARMFIGKIEKMIIEQLEILLA